MTILASIEAIAAVGAEAAAPASNPIAVAQTPTAQASFADMLSRAGNELEARIDRADDLTRRFVIGDDVPAHEVIIALEEARLAVELAVEVRTRTVEAYREIMNMQL